MTPAEIAQTLARRGTDALIDAARELAIELGRDIVGEAEALLTELLRVAPEVVNARVLVVRDERTAPNPKPARRGQTPEGE